MDVYLRAKGLRVFYCWYLQMNDFKDFSCNVQLQLDQKKQMLSFYFLLATFISVIYDSIGHYIFMHPYSLK